MCGHIILDTVNGGQGYEVEGHIKHGLSSPHGRTKHHTQYK